MYSLYIDTHTSNIVICLFKDDKLLQKKEKESIMQHSVYTLPMINELLSDFKLTVHDLDEIVVVNGPGSFTGVRIGVTIAKTMAYSLKIPIKVISSLLVKAINIDSDVKKVSLVDKHGAFVATFDKDNKVVDNYKYIHKSEYDNLSEEYVNEVSINYENVMAYTSNMEAVNPHNANPLYVKNVEVLKSDKAS